MADEALALFADLRTRRAAERGGLCRDQRSLHGDFAGPLVSDRIRQAQPQCRHAHGAPRGGAIEQSLAAQKDESLAAQREAANAQREAANAQREAADAVADNSLAEAKLVEALIAIRGALEAAQTSAMGAIDGLALNEKLAPVRKGARVIREIAWRLREIGNDGRICDLIDSQVQVIEQGAEQISSDEAKAALEAAFASLAGRIAEFSDEETPAAVAEAPSRRCRDADC